MTEIVDSENLTITVPEQGPVGPQGVQGIQGIQGIQGQQGPPGTGGGPYLSNPLMDGAVSQGTSGQFARGDHVHPSDTSRLALTGGTMTGNLSINNVADADISLHKAAAGSQNLVLGYTGTNPRWAVVLGDSTAESGSNNGSAYGVARFTDGGVYIDTPLTISRATGIASYNSPPVFPTPTARDNTTKAANTTYVDRATPNSYNNSGIPTLTEFSGAPISSQGLLNNSFSIYAAPTNMGASTLFSAYADQTNLSGSGTSTVANFAASTGAAQANFVRVNSTFLEDHTTSGTEHVAMFVGARKHGGAATFAANIQVLDDSSGGSIIGCEIDVDGNAGTPSSLGLGIYARVNPSVNTAFSGGNAILVDTGASATWTRALHLTGTYALEGINTCYMGNAITALHMGNLQQLTWDGATQNVARAWIRFNNGASRFEFFIDGAMIGHIP